MSNESRRIGAGGVSDDFEKWAEQEFNMSDAGYSFDSGFIESARLAWDYNQKRITELESMLRYVIDYGAMGLLKQKIESVLDNSSLERGERK